MPTLNEKLAEVAINKIHETTENIDYEIIVVSPFEMSGPNIKWIPEAKATGSCRAHATAWEASEGDIIVTMCDDLYPAPRCFQEMIEFLIEREKIYFPYSCGLNHQDMRKTGKHFGTLFGYYYPFYPALSRKSIEKIDGYHLRDYASHYCDCDMAMRVWDAGGRCELCHKAIIHSIDNLGIPEIKTLSNERPIGSHQKGYEIFLGKWKEKYGKEWGRQFNISLPISLLRENTMCKSSENYSEVFPEILHKTDSGLLNIKGYHLMEVDCILLRLLLRKIAKKQMKVVEIGSWKGMATAIIGSALQECKGTLFAIDTWKGSSSVPSMVKEVNNKNILNIFIENMKTLGLFHEIVKPIVMESIAAAQIFPNNSLDFIFIDGDHSYSSIKQDILAWLPKLKEGGTISGSCADAYYSQYSEEVQAEIDRKFEVDLDCIEVEGIVVHLGVVKATYEVFGDRHEIIPGTSFWHYQKKVRDSQWSVDSSKPNKLNPYYAAHVKILLNILGETTKEEPGEGSIYQSERIFLVAQYCIQGWNGDLIQLGFQGRKATKKLAELAQKFNRRLVIVSLAEEAETRETSSNLEEALLKDMDVVSIINSDSLTEETIESIRNQEFCFAFIEGIENYDTCLTAIKTVAACSGVIAVDNILESQEISRAFLQGSEFTNRIKLYLPLCREGYLLWS
ncbi:MAG: hypothetical protein F6K17_13445 [Okeania sp. SIO3C4]|nr:hypothetical protein [Okeania sp. SIO3C4]